MREANETFEARGLLAEIEAVIQAAFSGAGKIVATGPEASASQPFVLVATDDGDAWMLDPERDQALCLAWHGERQPYSVRDLPNHIEVEWDGHFDLRGPFFAVTTRHPLVGSRAIAGYPIDEMRRMFETLRSVDKRIEGIFGLEDAVELTDDVVDQLVRMGWTRVEVLNAARLGARYSPSRDSILFPSVSNF